MRITPMFFDALRYFPPPCLGPARAPARRKVSLLGRPWLEALEDRTLPAHPGAGLPHLAPPGLVEARGAAHEGFHTAAADTHERGSEKDGPGWHGGRGEGHGGEERNDRRDRHTVAREEDSGGKFFGHRARDDEGGLGGKGRTLQDEGRVHHSRAALLPDQPDEQMRGPDNGAAEFTETPTPQPAAELHSGPAPQFASAPGRVAAETAAPVVIPEDSSWVGALVDQPAGAPGRPSDQEGQGGSAGAAPGNSATFFTSLGGLSPGPFSAGAGSVNALEEGTIDRLLASDPDLGLAWAPELPADGDLAAGLLPGGPRPDILPPDAPRAAPVVTLLGWEVIGDKAVDAPPADRAVQDLFIDPLGVVGEGQEATPPAAPSPDAQTSSAWFGRTCRAAALAAALFLGVALFAQQEVGRRGERRRGRELTDLP